VRGLRDDIIRLSSNVIRLSAEQWEEGRVRRVLELLGHDEEVISLM